MSGWNGADVETLRGYDDDRRKIEAQIRQMVAAIREDGCPWSVIGDALGITKQAAQQRFGSQAPAARSRERHASDS